MKKTPLTYARELYAQLDSVPPESHRAVIRRLLDELARSRKTNLRPRIVAAFADLALAIEGYRPGCITTAKEIDHSVRAQMHKTFKNVVFEERTDPSLLGGAVIEVDGIRTDGSVRSKLDALKNAITNANN